MTGIFISMEGPDGSGKTTQIELLKKYLNDKGYEIIITREPGGTVISEAVREIILNKEYTNVQAVITIVDKHNNYYTIELLHQDFDSFKDIYYKVIEEMKKKYGIDLKEIGSYRTIISGSYHRNL